MMSEEEQLTKSYNEIHEMSFSQLRYEIIKINGVRMARNLHEKKEREKTTCYRNLNCV